MLQKRINSFKYAFKGIGRLFRTQVNAWIHLVAASCVAAAGLYFDISTIEWCICVIAVGGVLSAEAFNTALEDLTDLVSPDHHPLAGHVKDLAAGAVLLFSIGAATAGILIFLPKIMNLFE